jgi:hypothetical protein
VGQGRHGMRGGTQGFGGEAEGSRTLGKPSRRWKYHMQVDLQEMVSDGAALTGVAEDIAKCPVVWERQ